MNHYSIDIKPFDSYLEKVSLVADEKIDPFLVNEIFVDPKGRV